MLWLEIQMHNAPSRKSHKRDKPKKQSRVSARKRHLTGLKKLAQRNDNMVIVAYYDHMLLDCYKTLDGLYHKADYIRDNTRIKQRVESEGINFVTKILPDYINVVLSLIDHREASFSYLKLKKDSRIPIFLGGITSLVLESTDQDIVAIALNCLYTICTSFKKLRGDYDQKILIKQFTDFVVVDAALPAEITSDMANIATVARELCKDFIKNIDLDSIKFSHPKPGPGATNTTTRKCERFSPNVLYRQVDDVLPYVDWFYYNPWEVNRHTREYLQLENTAVARPTARFKFVAKVAGKPRGICIEENEVQVLQQAVRNGLWSYIEDSNIRENLPLTNQTVNASLALSSSIDQTLATIDMSEASDRISRFLVNYLFQDNEELCKVLMALSTRLIIPPDIFGVRLKPIDVNKYAPMGSGLCFPIMSLVHLFLVQSIILSTDHPNKRTLIKDVRVYGDDIVLPSTFALEVFKHLPMFGMKLNAEKSFVNGKFRESCGVHAYNGQDITPVYVKYIPKNDDVTQLQSMLANESDFFKKGFYETAKFLRCKLKLMYPDCSFSRYVSSDSNGLVGFYRDLPPSGVDALKKECKVKWNRDLQCKMYRIPRFKTRVDTAELNEDESLLRWLWTHAENSRIVDDSVEVTTITWQWIPESHLYYVPATPILRSYRQEWCMGGLNW